MKTAVVKTADGRSVTLTADELAAFRGNVKGMVCVPGEPQYDEARTLWNAMIDRRPALVVRAAAPGDVVATVKLGGKHGLLLAVRGGGHNIAGNAACDGGLMLDLSLMRGVRVEPATKTAVVEPGARLSDVDKAAQQHRLATPIGINSTTGIAGLTLGGGFGWLSRKHGLTIDNLLSADVVTAAGDVLRASASENADLFWAIRGGGGNFGVVTSFTFRLHDVGPEVIAGLIVHPFAQAKQVLRAYRKAVAEAPDELCCWAVMRKAPPLPFLPAEVHGTPVLILALCCIGDPAAAEEAVAPIKAIGKPIADVVGVTPYAGWQTAFDPLLAPGERNYWKSHDFVELSDGLIDVLIDAVGKLPTEQCEIFIAHMGGAINRVAPDATAYPHRDVEYVMNAHGRWSGPQDDAKCMAWGRALYEAAVPFATGGVYVNFMPEDEAARVRSGAYGPNYERLMKLKAKYDPKNLFRLNQNVAPAATAPARG